MRLWWRPQALGQLIWCLAHVLWIGNSFMITTSAALLVRSLCRTLPCLLPPFF